MGFEKGHKVGKRFQPGQSGNPGGMPGILKQMLDARPQPDGLTRREQTLAVLLEMAIDERNLKALEMLLAREFPASLNVELSAEIEIAKQLLSAKNEVDLLVEEADVVALPKKKAKTKAIA